VSGWLEAVRWNAEGLVPVVAQEAAPPHRVLMLAWMNREALERTVATGRAVYWSRSRGRLWAKGERSGHVQRVREIRLDCDGDTLLLLVEQEGLACHTGRRTCFHRRLEAGGWAEAEPVERDPRVIYGEGGGEGDGRGG